MARADVLLALAAMAVVAMLVVPLPTAVLDLLLSLNLAVGAVLLLVSLYVRSASALTALPSILLLTTLLRLSLNVSSTRLILLQADAGRVIDAFGDFVVQGNFVVGAVVFLVLTLVQFIVIARGSERVAEVAARFSLDSMPGRQMAIDADMRAGAIDLETARRQRADLHRESRFHGAMDGAMKFVKGDAIASIVITVINIVGGLVVGVGQRSMGFGEAAEVYTLLTIGDGLVSQIPALLIATGAGIVVTRVAGDSEHLAGDIATQILAHPRALGFAAGLLALLSLVPGLPLVPFLALALCLGALTVVAQRRTRSDDAAREHRFAPLSVVAPREQHRDIRQAWARVVAGLEADLGVHPPALGLLAGPSGAPVEIFVRSVPEVTVAASEVGSALDRVARQHATDLLGLQEVDTLLKALREVAPADVEAVVPRHMDLASFRAVLAGLLAEGVPITDLRSILGVLAAAAPKAAHTPDRIDAVREGLKRAITHRVTGGSGQFTAVTVSPEIESMVLACAREVETGSVLVMAPSIRRDIVGAARALLDEGDVVLSSPEVRRHLRAVLAPHFPTIWVVAHTELTGDVVVTPRAELRVGA